MWCPAEELPSFSTHENFPERVKLSPPPVGSIAMVKVDLNTAKPLRRE